MWVYRKSSACSKWLLNVPSLNIKNCFAVKDASWSGSWYHRVYYSKIKGNSCCFHLRWYYFIALLKLAADKNWFLCSLAIIAGLPSNLLKGQLSDTHNRCPSSTWSQWEEWCFRTAQSIRRSDIEKKQWTGVQVIGDIKWYILFSAKDLGHAGSPTSPVCCGFPTDKMSFACLTGVVRGWLMNVRWD